MERWRSEEGVLAIAKAARFHGARDRVAEWIAQSLAADFFQTLERKVELGQLQVELVTGRIVDRDIRTTGIFRAFLVLRLDAGAAQDRGNRIGLFGGAEAKVFDLGDLLLLYGFERKRDIAEDAVGAIGRRIACAGAKPSARVVIGSI